MTANRGDACRECAARYFRADKKANLYPDPGLTCASPWCLLYETMLKKLARSDAGTAAMLSRIKTQMAVEQRAKVNAMPGQLDLAHE